ncbi:MAG: bifunctional oligoribonuclease/PAP phosphatase NrnA [Bacteroidetes bacterium]|jgi:phosphoesterase RecJ-like protein|nr:bifunctional oligoribonuclease/PAP phosphatase NrnA [Bacteroidota bacterium]
MFEEFIKKVKPYHRIGVISHVRPDGDCVGAQVSLCRWLRKNGHKVWAFNDDEIPSNLQWLTKIEPIRQPNESDFEKCDLFILVDGNALHRFGLFSEWIDDKNRPIFMVDHHPDPEDSFDVSISVEEASSTCELLYGLYNEHDIDQLDAAVAKALYTGIITDTGSLQFESVTPKTVATVSKLLERGNFRPNEVIEVIYSNKSPEQMRLLSKALQTIQLFEDNQIAVMSVTKEMLEETGTSTSDCEGFVKYPLSIKNIKAAILVKDFYDEGIRISLRSKSNVDVNRWARELGGGGHKKASGAWHEGPREKAIRETVSIGAKQLKNLEKTSIL